MVSFGDRDKLCLLSTIARAVRRRRSKIATSFMKFGTLALTSSSTCFMGRRDNWPGPCDTQPELWTGPQHKARPLSAYRLKTLSTPNVRGCSVPLTQSGCALLTVETERWPKSARTPRTASRQPPPFEVGWGDGRPTGSNHSRPFQARMQRPSSELAAPSGPSPSCTSGAQESETLRALKAENEQLQHQLELLASEKDRLIAAFEASRLEADAMRMEWARVHGELAARDAAEAALRQMGLMPGDLKSLISPRASSTAAVAKEHAAAVAAAAAPAAAAPAVAAPAAAASQAILATAAPLATTNIAISSTTSATPASCRPTHGFVSHAEWAPETPFICHAPPPAAAPASWTGWLTSRWLASRAELADASTHDVCA